MANACLLPSAQPRLPLPFPINSPLNPNHEKNLLSPRPGPERLYLPLEPEQDARLIPNPTPPKHPRPTKSTTSTMSSRPEPLLTNPTPKHMGHSQRILTSPPSTSIYQIAKAKIVDCTAPARLQPMPATVTPATGMPLLLPQLARAQSSSRTASHQVPCRPGPAPTATIAREPPIALTTVPERLIFGLRPTEEKERTGPENWQGRKQSAARAKRRRPQGREASSGSGAQHPTCFPPPTTQTRFSSRSKA